MDSVRDALAGEYRRVLWFVHHHPDLVEGIRAQLVDKDRNPHWDRRSPEIPAGAGVRFALSEDPR